MPVKNKNQNNALNLSSDSIEGALQKAEEKLRHSEEMYKTLVETFPDAVTVTDLKGNITYVSQQTLKLHGFNRAEEVIGKSAFELIAPKDHKRAMENLKKTFKKGSVKNLIYTLLRKDGTSFIGELNASLIKDAYEKPKAFIGTTRDITEREGTEKRLKESESRLLEQKQALEQKTVALGEIIKQIEVEKSKIKEDMAININDILLPIVAKLKIKNASRKYIQLFQSHLRELGSSFGRKITEKSARLTSREIEICSMIKGGLTSKEVAQLLNISHQTVERHRKNIRNKLGISNKDINLTSFLYSLK